LSQRCNTDMNASRGRLLSLSILLCIACTPTASAGAAGAPIPSWHTGKTGAVAPGGSERLTARRSGENTLVTAVRRSDRQLLRSREIVGRWTIPAATLEGATTGLSADGRTLALVRPTRIYPPTSTELAVVDARELTVRREVSLSGFFTIDAISPDGRWLYLIQYADANAIDYRVRALDTRTDRFASRDVVDPRAPDEQMGGLPMTRAMSRDGRWAYTLYGGGEETFIHALDTVGRTAACIDLDMLPPDGDLSGYNLGVSPDGRRLRVRDSGGSLVAIVDTRNFAVREPGEPFAAEPTSRPASRKVAVSPVGDGDGFPWLPVILVAGLAGLCAVATRVAILRRPT
jgi:hypothetical protein